MTPLENLSVKTFADEANLAAMRELYQRPYIKGSTTNPTLVAKYTEAITQHRRRKNQRL
jgi:transaldolase